MKTTAVAAAALVALVAADDAIVACTTKFGGVLTAAATNDGAKACATETGLSLTVVDVSDAALKKIGDAKACQAWWTATVAAANKISPPCEMVNPFAATVGTTVTTDKFAATLA
ncbi:hypothetical protein As57867_005907, partial [Aphanomyces stellatus]